MRPLQPRRIRKSVIRHFIERTIGRERLGFEACTWAAQRITGLILLGFLIIHLYTLSSIWGGETVYNHAMKSMERPLIKIGEVGLLWVMLFHSLNGFRLILINLFPGINHKRLAYSIPIISLLLVFISFPLIL